jgi:hypothetical protein
MKAARGQKQPSEAPQKSFSQQLHHDLINFLAGPIRFELQPQVRNILNDPRSLL